jgi:hypothetical protein
VAGLLAACGSVEERPEPAAAEVPTRPLPAPGAAADPPLPQDHGIGFETFAAAVAAAWRGDPGPVAVLPPFSDDPLHPRGTQVFVNGAGDWLADQTLSALRAAAPDVELWAPATVVAELARSNRSLRDLRVTLDAVPLLAMTDAGYLVYGNVEKEVVGGRLSGETRVRVRLLGVRLATGETVAACDATVTAPAAVRDLAARAERASAVPVGARAPAFTPSLDLEVALATERALARLLGAHRAVFAGKRCAVTVETPEPAAGRALAATVRSTLLARLGRALPGKDGVTVVDAASGGADLVLHASFARGADRGAVALTASRPGERDGVHASAPLDPRFHAELRRAVP